MSFLLNMLVTLVALVATSVLLPQLPLSVLRLVLRGVGWLVQRRTKSRKEFIVSRVRADDEDFLSKRARSSPRTQAADEDWEKVDTSSSSTAGNANKGPGDDDWDGVIGFFHPFWYDKIPGVWLRYALVRSSIDWR